MGAGIAAIGLLDFTSIIKSVYASPLIVLSLTSAPTFDQSGVDESIYFRDGVGLIGCDVFKNNLDITVGIIGNNRSANIFKA
jgi:hypothetical protein